MEHDVSRLITIENALKSLIREYSKLDKSYYLSQNLDERFYSEPKILKKYVKILKESKDD